MARNLFTTLFSYRPREGMTPRENYLTEAFAYVLDVNEDVCRAFVRAVLPVGTRTEEFSTFKIQTQAQETSIDFDVARPDMWVACERSGNDDFFIYSEHKWESDTDSRQLQSYAKLVEQRNGSAILVFICSTIMQSAEAQAHCAKVLLWEDVYDLLLPFRSSPPILDFLEFLKAHDLSPHTPLSLSKIAAHSFSVEVPADCGRIVQQLMHPPFSWDSIPLFYRDRHLPKERWGRVGLEFYNTAMRPQIFVGFLLDPKDHALEFVDGRRGIDLALFIECDPATTKPKGSAWVERAKALRLRFPPIVVRDHTEIISSRWRKLTVQECLADVIHGRFDEESQTQAIYERLQSWAVELFARGDLERAMLETWPTPSRFGPDRSLLNQP